MAQFVAAIDQGTTGTTVLVLDDQAEVEALYAAEAEGALHVDDVLTRRTRTSIESYDRGVSAAEPVARLMGEALGWDEARVQREVTHYLRRVDAERDSQNQPDDTTADAARMGDGSPAGLRAAEPLVGTPS